MKHWVKYKSRRESSSLELKSCDRVLSIQKKGDKYIITEMCDEVFHAEYSKEEMLELIEELRQQLEIL